ncbi:hypothetical protein Plhal304r1_c015g0056941 [Plasmopara halstedii]
MAAAAGAALVAARLAHWQYQQYVMFKKRHQSLKLLQEVESIVIEVASRLMQLDNQVKELLKYDIDKEGGVTELDEAADSTLNSCALSNYHFDSQANKLKTKWDSYDVDADLETDKQGNTIRKFNLARLVPTHTRSKALAISHGIEQEFEAVLSFLDDIRGDVEVKRLRKSIVSKITTDYLARIDTIQAMIKSDS